MEEADMENEGEDPILSEGVHGDQWTPEEGEVETDATTDSTTELPDPDEAAKEYGDPAVVAEEAKVWKAAPEEEVSDAARPHPEETKEN